MNRLKNSYSTCMSCGGKKMKSGGKWIQSAIKKPGSFTAQANKAGMSVPAFRDKVLSNKEAYSSTTVKRANLAKTLAGMRKGEDGMEMDALPRVQAVDPLNLAAKTTLNKLETLPKGASPKVQAYQEMLRSKGYDIAADGAWGPKTQKAYEDYINKSKTKMSSSNATSPMMGPTKANKMDYSTKKPLNWSAPVSNSVMSTASNLKKTAINPSQVLKVAEPAGVTSAFNNLSKYKKAAPASKVTKKMSADEALVRNRLARFQSGKSIYGN
jgi:hypothetical protein